MFAVVSPAKKLDTAPLSRTLPLTQPDLLTEAKSLVKIAAKLRPSDLANLMKISDKLADLNHARFQSFTTPFTIDNAKPAALMFAGDTYTGLDADSLSTEDLTWAQEHFGILSGLYGLLRPLDLIQPYRLEMGSKLQTARGKNLYQFWDERITAQLQERLEDHQDKTLVNLASVEYFKAVKPKTLPSPVITPVFKERRDGGPKIISFMAKRARGMMARFIIQGRIDRPEGLKDFRLADYRFEPAASTANTPTFIR
jgi:cytoplasmic iron level regulating protein YaaA (DUF328/UPF0246 family)